MDFKQLTKRRKVESINGIKQSQKNNIDGFKNESVFLHLTSAIVWNIAIDSRKQTVLWDWLRYANDVFRGYDILRGVGAQWNSLRQLARALRRKCRHQINSHILDTFGDFRCSNVCGMRLLQEVIKPRIHYWNTDRLIIRKTAQSYLKVQSYLQSMMLLDTFSESTLCSILLYEYITCKKGTKCRLVSSQGPLLWTVSN